MIRFGLFFLSLIFLTPSTLRAGFFVDVLDSNITAGGTGWIDVQVYDDANLTHQVSLASYRFVIVPNAGAIGSLQFIQTQVLTEQQSSNYAFREFQEAANNAFFADVSLSDPLTLEGGDFSIDESPTLIDSTRKLLIRLDVEHLLSVDTNPSAAAGSTFTVSLASDSFSEFLDEDSNPISFSSRGGIATITAVPEPSSLLLLAGTGLGWFLHLRRRADKNDTSRRDSSVC